MIDPVSAIALATSAYRGIKKGLEVGKELSEMGNSLSAFAKAASDIDFLEKKAEKPPLYKMFGDTEAHALEIWTKKKKMAEMREELRSHISWHYGPSAWDEIVKIEGEQRKRQRELVYKKQEFIDSCINITICTLSLLAGAGIIVVTVYLVGAKQGKW
jgi:hypothetical protein|tara:strand:+ start:456 stop:929 length:474 start_codon:yes stop_codon:yes gene_type:complete